MNKKTEIENRKDGEFRGQFRRVIQKIVFIIKENEGKATVKEINCPELNSSSFLEFKDIFLPKRKGTVFPLRTDRGAGGWRLGNGVP